MQHTITVADFMESNAHLFTCQGKDGPQFVSPDHEEQCRQELLTLFASENTLKAGSPVLPPLVPGHYYKVIKPDAQCLQGCILLENSDNAAEQGQYAISALGFLNAFADTPLPDATA